ncbi:hypothetical protein TYRP_020026 [Tyrophagus putrescentiae]|nr:hypothetical protein TYRP_020026 [Tyrophagus putrescentiae]
MYFDFDDRVTYQVQLTAEACAADICLDNNIIGWYRASPNLHTTFTTQKLFGPEMLLLLMEGRLKEDHERLVKEAELYSDKVKKQSDQIAAQNALESYDFQIKSTFEDDAMKSKISEENREKVSAKLGEINE